MYNGRGGRGAGKVERSERLSWWGGGGGCLLKGLGGGVEDLLLVVFHNKRLVSSLPDAGAGEGKRLVFSDRGGGGSHLCPTGEQLTFSQRLGWF